LSQKNGGASTILHFWTKKFIGVIANIKKIQILFTF
jgi:hypothetical protein